jgi:hypothetical protein
MSDDSSLGSAQWPDIRMQVLHELVAELFKGDLHHLIYLFGIAGDAIVVLKRCVTSFILGGSATLFRTQSFGWGGTRTVCVTRDIGCGQVRVLVRHGRHHFVLEFSVLNQSSHDLCVLRFVLKEHVV